jgi:hypothetical protein
MVFTDPPYNVRVSSIQGRGKKLPAGRYSGVPAVLALELILLKAVVLCVAQCLLPSWGRYESWQIEMTCHTPR